MGRGWGTRGAVAVERLLQHLLPLPDDLAAVLADDSSPEHIACV